MGEQGYKAPKKRGIKKGLMAVLILVCCLVWVVIIAAVIHFENLLSLINRADEEIMETISDEQYQQMLDDMQQTVPEDFTGPVLESDEVQWGEETGLIEEGEDIINILLLGQDRRTQEGSSRTDVIILATVNKPAKTLTLTSFMRDLYVQIPGRDDNRINVPYLVGGTELLGQCLQENFGITVDGAVVVDFYSFIDVVNLMGGVDIELTAEEAEYMNANYSWDVDDGEDDDWNLTEGVNHLTGSQTLSYARMRMVGNSDYQRTERQRTVLTKLLEKAKTLRVSELNVLLQHVLPMIATDMDNGQILSYGLELFPLLSQLEINTLRIPVEGAYEPAMIDGMYVLVPDMEENCKVLEDIMRIPRVTE